MVVVYKGTISSKSKGCIPCGKRGGSSYAYIKSIVCPSGQAYTFYANQPKEVRDSDVDFLLSLNTGSVNTFEVV